MKKICYFIKCGDCEGKGKIINEAFEKCKDADWLEEFNMQEGSCSRCPEFIKRDCKEGEMIDCDQCDGAGLHCFMGELMVASDQDTGKNIYHIDLKPLKDSSLWKNISKPIGAINKKPFNDR